MYPYNTWAFCKTKKKESNRPREEYVTHIMNIYWLSFSIHLVCLLTSSATMSSSISLPASTAASSNLSQVSSAPPPFPPSTLRFFGAFGSSVVDSFVDSDEVGAGADVEGFRETKTTSSFRRWSSLPMTTW